MSNEAIKKSEFNDFVGIFENAIPENVCNKFISTFEGWKKHNFVFNRQAEGERRHDKDDEAFAFANHYDNEDLMNELIVGESGVGLFGVYKDYFNECFRLYVNHYSKLLEIPLSIYYSKIQKTKIGGGFHQWHCERDNLFSSNRAFAYMVYLNDVAEGGETEFLYQKMRVKPTRGTVVIWPSDWTHTHRGNPPLSGVKYVYTGWIEYVHGATER